MYRAQHIQIHGSYVSYVREVLSTCRPLFFCVWSRGCVWFGLLGIGLVLVYVGRTARIRKRLLCCTLILSSAQELANRSLQSCPSDWSSAQTRNFRLVPWESGRGGFNGNINVLSQSVRLLSQFRCLRVLPAGNDLFSIEMGGSNLWYLLATKANISNLANELWAFHVINRKI